jgi:hypothetical protein
MLALKQKFLDGLSKWRPAERHGNGGAWCPPATLAERPMKYMLMIYSNEAAMQARNKADTEQLLAAYTAYTEALKTAGIMVGGERLQPTSAATTVRISGGKTNVLDGPYAEAKEQFGGYYMIDVPDIDAALSWAARCPAASHGIVEVRPLWVM